ncbi:MAG: transposase [Solirubrobacterales bacterium]|nr:transposase [Solirubrobacterales bacterium]
MIAIDPFHVVALAKRALDDVRRAYWNKLRELDDAYAARRFKDARWSLLKAPTASTTNSTARSDACAPPAARYGAPTRSRKRSGRSSSPASSPGGSVSARRT